MNKQPVNTNKELLKLKQELIELNCRISTQQEHIQTLCLEVEEREKELRFHYKTEKIINNAALSPEKIFQKIVDILPEAFQFPELTAISLKINGWIFNSKEFIDSNLFIETNIQIENSLIGFIKAYYKNDGHQKISKKFLKEEKDLLKILSKRLSEYYVKYLNDVELKKNEDKYQSLVDNINDVIYEITADGTLKYINNAAYLISGYHPNELIGKSYFENIYPNDLPLVYKALSELGNEKYIHVEFRYLTKDGKIKWVRSSTKTILENGIAIGGRGVLIDIHETKLAQILLAQNEKKLQFKTRLQELLVDISNKYINLPLNQLDFKINKSLSDLGQFIGVDRFYIFDYDFENKTCSNTYEWCAEGIEAQIDELQNVPFEYFPEWLNAHCKGETLYVEDVLALDPEDNLRIILEPQGIKSLVTVPIMDGNKCLGFTGFDAVKDYHTYSSEEVELLKVFAQMLVNIKNRLKSQKELEDSNQKLNVLLNNLNGVIYHSDFDGKNWNLSFINDAVLELTGYKAVDFINNTKIEFNDLIDKEDLPRVLKEVHNATNNKLPYNIEYRIFNAAGQQKWVWENGHGVFDGNKLIGQEGFISDISDKKRIEQELLKSEEELNQAQEIAKMGSWYMNLLTNEITLSHNYYKLVEREEKEVKSKEDLLFPLIYKDDVHLIENKLAEIAAHKSQGTQELRLIMPDGRIKWVQSTILPVYHNDVLVAYKGVKIDITEKKLQESEINKLINAVEQSPVSIIVTNLDGSIEYANPKACEISGYTKEELETKNPRIFQSGETQQQEYSELWDTISSGKEWKGIFHNKKKDGTLFWESAVIAPIFDSYGNITQYLALKEDITHKKELDEELALKEFRYRELAEHSHTVIWEVDTNGLYTYVSPVAETVYGFSTNELIEKKYFYDLAPEEVREEVKTYGLEAMRKGALMVNFDNKIENKEGKIIWVNTNGKPFFDGKNNLIGYRGSDSDITEKKLQEEEIRHKNAKLNAILEAMPDMIFTSDSDGNYLEFFKSISNTKNDDNNHLIGKNLRDAFPDEAALLHIEKIKECLQTKKMISYEYPIFEKGKTSYRDGRIVFMGENKVLRFVRDITEQKRAELEIIDLNTNLEVKIEERTLELQQTNNNLQQEIEQRKQIEEALSKSEYNYRSVIENVNEVIFKTDENGLWLFLNKSWEEITGFTVEESLGELFVNYVHPEDRQRNMELFMPLINREKDFCRHQVRYLNKDGGFRWIEVFARLSLNEQNEITGTFGTLQDITERKIADKEVSNAKNEAVKANNAKSEFLSRMSHELRTPLTSILGFSQLLKMSNLSEAHKTNVDYIYSSGKHLLDLINEVLDISKIEAGKISLSIEPIQVSVLLNEVIDTLQPQVNKMNINLIVLDSSCNELYVNADLKRLKQVLLNLLDNAIKYNKKSGSLKIFTKIMPKNSIGIAPLRISIMDTGVGISKYDISKIFIPFERIGAERTEVEGTGLGLSVVKKLIGAMGGKIGVESVLDEGSTFWFELPLAENIKTVINLTSKKTELIAALADANKELDFQNEEKGKRANELEIANIELAFQNEEKGKRANELEIANIELDFQNGEKVKRADELEIANIEISALKGHISKTAKYLAKRPYTILYVEDNIFNIKLVKNILNDQYAPINLITDITGSEAVKLAIENQPDLILLDLDLPFMQGSEILELLLKEEKTKKIPVIIITASIFPKQREKLLKEGAKEYINKPIDIPAFLKILEEYLIKK